MTGPNDAPPRRRVPKWISVVRRFNSAMHYVAGVALLGILFLTVADITGRSAFNNPVPGTVEVTQMALVVVVFLAVAHSEDMGDHITIDLIYERLGKVGKRILDVFADVVTLVIVSLLAFQLYQFAQRNVDSGAETPVLEWPVWPFVYIAAFGMGLYAISTVMRIVLRLIGAPINAGEESDEAAGGVEI